MAIDIRALESACHACDNASGELSALLEDLESLEDNDPDAEKPTVRCLRCGTVSQTGTTTAIRWRGAGIDRVCSECAGQLMDWLQNT